MDELAVIVPTRGRPQNCVRVVQAWIETGAFDDGAALAFVYDESDPLREQYREQLEPVIAGHDVHLVMFTGPHMPMVPKLNYAALAYAMAPSPPFALGFAGDDHLPRTRGWADRYIATLYALGNGIVYGADGMRPRQRWPLPTQWVMTTDIVHALGRMVPAPVQHLYCDNAIRDLGRAADCLTHLPDVMIEHVHPLAGKAALDDGYRAVNSTLRYVEDRAAYRRWVADGLDTDAATVRGLTKG